MNRLLCALIVVLIAYIRRPRPEVLAVPAWVSTELTDDDLNVIMEVDEPTFEEAVEDAIDMIDGMGDEENELLVNILLDPCYITVDSASN